MTAESHRIWRNRNAYAIAAALSLYGLFHGAFRLLVWKDLDSNRIFFSLIDVLLTGFLVIRCASLASSADAQLWSLRANAHSRVEDRLDELERLRRRDMVTPEAYSAKRREIIKDL